MENEQQKADIGRIDQLLSNAQFVLKSELERAKKSNEADVDASPLGRRIPQKDAAVLIKRDPNTIRRAIADNKISAPLDDPDNGRQKGWTIKNIFEAQNYFGTQPSRNKETDECAVVAIMNLKGGVGKTETCSNLSRMLAQKGYKGLVIDLDSQASATSAFGFIPDSDFGRDDTVVPFLGAEQETLHYAIRTDTKWPNLHLIPACLSLQWAEFDLLRLSFGAETTEERLSLYENLSRGIDTIKDDYDFIIIDCPPALSISTISILLAATSIVIPVSPAKHDMAATVQYLSFIKSIVTDVMPGKEWDFIKLLVTKYTDIGVNDAKFFKIARMVFGDLCYPKVFRQMSAIKDASADFRTVFESSGIDKRVYEKLIPVFEQIEEDILKTWPSKRQELEDRGIVV